MTLFALIFYNLLFPLLFVLYLPIFLFKLIKRGDYNGGFLERFGIFSASKKEKLKNLKSPIWVHAVSLGETITALSFIREWTKLEPGLQFVLSTTTSSGQKLAQKQAPKNVVTIYCPIDYFICVWAALNTIKLQMLIIFEVEIWPNLIVFASRLNIKLALVNGRMSDNSARNYSRHRWFFRNIFSRFSIICAQSEEDAHRIKAIIGNQLHVKVCNTMKFDQGAPDLQENHMRALIDRVFPDKNRIIFIAASTHPGEELTMVRAFKIMIAEFPSLEFILAPRHIERANEVEKLLKKESINYALLTDLVESRGNDHSSPLITGSFSGELKKNILLVNTTGELRSLYAISDIVFIGKSLGKNRGGHNIIEPAIFGKPIIFGRNMDNFRQVAKIFKENNAAIEVENEQGFLLAFHRLLSDPVERKRLEKISRETVEKNRGAISKTIELLRADN